MLHRWLPALSLAGLCAAAGAAGVEPLPTVQIADGVHVHYGAVQDWSPANGGDAANAGFIVGGRCVAVIDGGGMPEIGRRLRAAIEKTTPLPVCAVITTHAHPDHLLGVGAFADTQASFIAHDRFAAALSARDAAYRNAVRRDFGLTLPASGLVYPTRGVQGRLEFDLGGRVLQLDAWPTAHTDNDLSVFDRQTRTLFLGDLLFVEHIPVLDGRLKGWLAVMQTLQGMDVALAVPGHGRASADWPGALAPQRTYLESLQRDTRSAIRRKMTISQAVEQIPVDASASWKLTESFHRRNVTAAYAELEWED